MTETWRLKVGATVFQFVITSVSNFKFKKSFFAKILLSSRSKIGVISDDDSSVWSFVSPKVNWSVFKISQSKRFRNNNQADRLQDQLQAVVV